MRTVSAHPASERDTYGASVPISAPLQPLLRVHGVFAEFAPEILQFIPKIRLLWPPLLVLLKSQRRRPPNFPCHESWVPLGQERPETAVQNRDGDTPDCVPRNLYVGSCVPEDSSRGGEKAVERGKAFSQNSLLTTKRFDCYPSHQLDVEGPRRFCLGRIRPPFPPR